MACLTCATANPCGSIPGTERKSKSSVITRFDFSFVNESKFVVNSLLQLITSKQLIYTLNVTEYEYLRKSNVWIKPLQEYIDKKETREPLILLSTAFEEKLRRIELEGDLQEYLTANVTHRSILRPLIQETFKVLDVIHFYTYHNNALTCWNLRDGRSISSAAAIVDINIHRCVSFSHL